MWPWIAVVLRQAALTRSPAAPEVVTALKSVSPRNGTEIMSSLDGCWRLVFATNSNRKTGFYFPLKAQQCFQFDTMTLNNGIYLGDVPLLKFFGEFTFDVKTRKLEFDFDTLKIFGFTIPLKQGDAVKFGSSTGLGGSKRPFFIWMDADDLTATAAGAGGGLALWVRV